MSRVFLNVSYKEREEAKILGAKWDTTAKMWYVPEGMDATPFEKWNALTKKRAAIEALEVSEKFFKTAPSYDFGRPLDTIIKRVCYDVLIQQLTTRNGAPGLPLTLTCNSTGLAKVLSISPSETVPGAIYVKTENGQFTLYFHYLTMRARLEHAKSDKSSEMLYQVDLLRTLNQKVPTAEDGFKVFAKDDTDSSVELLFSWH